MTKVAFLMLVFFSLHSRGTMRMLSDYLTEKDLQKNPKKNAEVGLIKCSIEKGSSVESYCGDLMYHVLKSNCVDAIVGSSVRLNAKNKVVIKLNFHPNVQARSYSLKEISLEPVENSAIRECFINALDFKPKKFIKHKEDISIELELGYVRDNTN